MNAAGDTFERHLLALFADEARGHLAQLEALLGALARPGAPVPARLRSVRDTLHTLKGAARAVELGDLEYLCHALDSVFAAAAGTDAALRPDHLALIRSALAVAGLLLEPPAGRVRNQALALIGQLDALARALAAPGLPDISPEPGT
jgi:two-component system chemotaxis sensor kinase CheA